MNKKISEVAKPAEEFFDEFPDWYWKHGLHDAEVLYASEIELEAFKGKPKHRKFVITYEFAETVRKKE